jgi:hypothetical protein
MKAAIVYIIAVVIVLGLIAWLGLSTLDLMVTGAEAAARAERDAHWKAEIATSNAEAETKLRQAEMAKQAADAAARDKISTLTLKLTELEKANDALPDNRCGGLGRPRVELLHRAPR